VTSEGTSDAPFTITHARLRASQGDLATARRVLRAILASDPDHVEAARLLEALGDGEGDAFPVETGGIEASREPATAEELAGRFRDALAPGDVRSERLRRWVEAIRRNRGSRRHAG
jgi:hypothetical protein